MEQQDNIFKKIFRTGDLPAVRYQLMIDNKDLIRICTALISSIVVAAVLVQLVKKSIK